MSPRLDSKLALYYAWPPTLIVGAVGTFLFSFRSTIAIVGQAAIALALLAQGVALISDFRGYASAAVNHYKQEPANYWIRATPRWTLRFGSGMLFVWMAAMYIWVALRTLS